MTDFELLIMQLQNALLYGEGKFELPSIEQLKEQIVIALGGEEDWIFHLYWNTEEGFQEQKIANVAKLIELYARIAQARAERNG